MENTHILTNKAKTILNDYFHSGAIQRLTNNEKTFVYKELTEIWNAIEDTKAIDKCSRDEVESMLGKPIEQIDTIWFYPSEFTHQYYAITFEKGAVSKTDFVTVKIA
jgi:hypothetical protein